MSIEKVVNIVIKDNISVSDKHVKELDKSLNSLQNASDGVKGSMKESSLSVLENGGAMGLLNDATGGLAMTVKDAVEATALFAKQSKISTTIQAAYATVVGASTGAMKIFRLALVGTGIGAIVVGLGLLIANFDKVKKVVMNLIPGLAVIGDIFNSLVETVTDFVGITSDATRELDRLGEQANKTLAKNKFALDAYGDTYDQYTKRKIEANNKYAQHVKDINEDETLSEKEKLAKLKILRETADREIEKASTDRQAEKDKKAKEAQDKINDANKAAADKELADRKAANAKLLEEQKAFNAEILKAQQDMNLQKVLQEIQDRLDEKDRKQIAGEEAFAAGDKVEEDREKEKENAKNKRDREALEEIEFQKNKDLAIASSRQNLNNIIGGIEASGLAKTKAGQVISKAIALTQIGIDSAVAISKASTLANAEGVAAQLAFPLVPGAGTIARVVSYASTAASVIGNIARAKALLSSGGSGSSSSSGGAGPSAPPQFNIVGQNSNNQLAQSIGNSQNRPIEAFVVSGNMTTAQSIDRNRIQTATFNS